MKKKLLIFPILVVMFIFSGCDVKQVLNKQTPISQSGETKILGNYLGSDYKGNYVWGGAMNLAWNELNDNILHEKLKFATSDKIALDMVDKFNNPVFSKNDLDEKSYYVKSGYGQETVDAINKESKLKFPAKSFSDLDFKLQATDIISYAYFLKAVEYKVLFEKKEVNFSGQKVTGFFSSNKDQRKNIKIIKYDSDDKFIISLKLKDENDQLILAKGYDMDKPKAVVDEIKKNISNLDELGESDSFEAPKLSLDLHRDYNELIGKNLVNKNFEAYFIAKMFENIKFNMDEKGAKVENEAAIMLWKSMAQAEKPKNLILDKPFWVIMKRQNSQNPYFILGVNNTELMEKK